MLERSLRPEYDGFSIMRWAYQSRQASCRMNASRPAVDVPTRSMIVPGEIVPKRSAAESAEVPASAGRSRLVS